MPNGKSANLVDSKSITKHAIVGDDGNDKLRQCCGLAGHTVGNRVGNLPTSSKYLKYCASRDFRCHPLARSQISAAACFSNPPSRTPPSWSTMPMEPVVQMAKATEDTVSSRRPKMSLALRRSGHFTIDETERVLQPDALNGAGRSRC